MNPLTNVRNITKLNEREMTLGIDSKNSWHNMYSSSAWIFIGGLNYDLSEGDVITVFSQYGEVVNINLIRDQKSGKSKGFCFLCYEDQRSTVLAVDNLNAIKLLNRTIRVDHVHEYKIPKEHEDMDDVTKRLHSEGCAPEEEVIRVDPSHGGQVGQPVLEININIKNEKKRRKERKEKRKKSRNRSPSSSSGSDSRSKRTKHKSKRRHKSEDKTRDDRKRSYDYERDYRKEYSSDRRHESYRKS